MFGLIVLAIVAIIPIGIAGMVDHCFGALPKEYLKVPPKMIWLVVTAFVLYIVANTLAFTAPLLAVSLAMAATVMFFLVRAIAFIGMQFSFRAYAREHPVTMSPAGMLLALIASFLDGIGVAALIVSSILTGEPQAAPDARGQSGLAWAILIVMAAGFFISIFYLLVMNGNKNKVTENERSERKEKTDQLLKEKRKIGSKAHA